MLGRRRVDERTAAHAARSVLVPQTNGPACDDLAPELEHRERRGAARDEPEIERGLAKRETHPEHGELRRETEVREDEPR